MVKSTTNVLHSATRLLARCLPAVLLAGLLPAALATPAAAGGGPFFGITATASDVKLGATVTVTSTTSFNVGPTPWWTQIYDLSTGTRLVACPTGTTCSAAVRRSSPSFGRFEAFLGALSTTPPPPSNQGDSGEVDVAWNAIDVTLSGTVMNISSTQFAFDLTARTRVDVGPTPYWIEIFNVTTGRELVACGRGTSCTVQTILPSGPVFRFQAFVTTYTTTIPTTFQGASLYTSTGGKG